MYLNLSISSIDKIVKLPLILIRITCLLSHKRILVLVRNILITIINSATITPVWIPSTKLVNTNIINVTL